MVWLASEVVNISHLLLAEDTLDFCGANPDQLRFLHVLFVSFEVVSGLKINLAKVCFGFYGLRVYNRLRLFGHNRNCNRGTRLFPFQ
jgi:hypothetical protein